MTLYYRPLVEEQGTHALAGGWCRFSKVEVLSRHGRAEVISANEVPQEILNRLTSARSDLGTSGSARPQVMGILNNASNLDLAKSFLEFSLTNGFQQHIPQGNWMYPVLNLKESQKEFYDAAPLPVSLDQVFPSSEEKDSWISSWEKSIIE